MVKRTNIKSMFLAVLTVFLMSGPHPASSLGSAKLQAASLPDDGVIVYQFHRLFRCEACYKLEAAINETLQTHFQEELKAGRLIFRLVNLDAEGNVNYSKIYDFFYNTVIVVDIENGKETRFKNLEEVWGLVDQKEAAIDFIRSHVAEYL